MNKSKQKHDYDKSNPWIWIDIETSGLDPDRSEILEIYAVVTDSNMMPVDHLHLLLHHPVNVLLHRSSHWCKRHFGKYGNGLFNECNYSTLSYADAEHHLWNFFEFYATNPIGTTRPLNEQRPFFDRTLGAAGQHINEEEEYHVSNRPHRLIMLAGSTIHFDREFLLKYFPCLRKLLNHKVIDVTSLLESVRRFNPEALGSLPKPQNIHRAGADIYDSINLYKYIKDNVLKIKYN